MRLARWLLWAVVVVVVGACSDSKQGTSSASFSSQSQAEAPAALWSAPTDPLARAAAAGLVPEAKESLTFHHHAHLDVFVDGEHITVPAGIGIDIANPGVHQSTQDGQPAYGGIAGCDQPCISPLHTHDVTGILHTESQTDVDHTLGQFFTEWGQRLDANCVASYCQPNQKIAVYINGQPYTGNPADITLVDQEEVAIVIGNPPDQIPSTADFSGA